MLDKAGQAFPIPQTRGLRTEGLEVIGTDNLWYVVGFLWQVRGEKRR